MRNIIKNQKVVDGLPVVRPVAYQHAYLIEDTSINIPTNKNTSDDNRKKLDTGIPLYLFMYNPESISMTVPISYSQLEVPYTGISQVNFSHGGNITMSMRDLLLDTRYEGRSLQLLIDRLIALREPTIKNGLKSFPKRLYFRWGANVFGACVLSNLQINITHWRNGYPIRAMIDMSLLEVPAYTGVNTAVEKAKVQINNNSKNSSNNKKPLTNKQVADGSKLISEQLRIRKSLLPKRLQIVLDDPKSRIKIDKDSWSVDLFNSTNKLVDNLGEYDGNAFRQRTSFKQ